MILMPQIFDVIAYENARYKRNEFEFPIHAPSAICHALLWCVKPRILCVIPFNMFGLFVVCFCMLFLLIYCILFYFQKAIKDNKIDLWEIDRDILGTEHEKRSPPKIDVSDKD